MSHVGHKTMRDQGFFVADKPSLYNRSCISGWFASSHSLHFLAVPPYSQYYGYQPGVFLAMAIPSNERSSEKQEQDSENRRGGLGKGREHTPQVVEYTLILSSLSGLTDMEYGMEKLTTTVDDMAGLGL